MRLNFQHAQKDICSYFNNATDLARTKHSYLEFSNCQQSFRRQLCQPTFLVVGNGEAPAVFWRCRYCPAGRPVVSRWELDGWYRCLEEYHLDIFHRMFHSQHRRMCLMLGMRGTIDKDKWIRLQKLGSPFTDVGISTCAKTYVERVKIPPFLLSEIAWRLKLD